MVRRALSTSLRRCLPLFRAHPLPRRHLSAAIPTSYAEPVASTSDSPHERRVRALVRNLQAGGGHARVWDSYTDIISTSGAASLPLQLHQQVLRGCSPSKDAHRETMRERISNGTFSDPFHIHENRFKVVIQNIMSIGQRPDVDDYNFIMDHLAAVGYYQGVLNLYKHMLSTNYTPTSHTFNACFRSIAFRFTLPIIPDFREDLVTYTTSLFQQLMADLQRFNLQLSPSNMELILRILKETLDRKSFEFLLRTSYGIDLANPDRLALEYMATSTDGTPRVPLPFTTATLNTTLDMLGRMGDVSRLVSAFEVLTQPLPQAGQHFFNAFEEDDDDPGAPAAVAASAAPRIPLPSAQPNTTTYTTLLRYVCRHGHPALARHYLLQAVALDRRTAWVLRHMVLNRLCSGDLSDVPAPRFALCRLALLPVLGDANRNKNLALLEWLADKVPAILRQQRGNLAFYEDVLVELSARGLLPPNDTDADAAAAVDYAPAPADADADADAPMPTPTPTPTPTFTPFDMRLHTRILRQNLAEIEAFATRLSFDLERTRQRVKERLGRRVWADKDVYLRSEDARVLVARDEWRAIVNFAPMDEAHQRMPRARSRGPFTPNPKPTVVPLQGAGKPRGMCTFAFALRGTKSMPPPTPLLWRRQKLPSLS